MRGGAGPLPERDRQVRPCLPARRLRSWRRTAPSPTPSAASRRVRQVMPPLSGKADWEVTQALRRRAGLPDALHASVADHGRDRRAHAQLRRCQLRRRSSAWAACSGRATRPPRGGTPIMHVGGFVRGRGRFLPTQYVPTDERSPALSAAPHHRAAC